MEEGMPPDRKGDVFPRPDPTVLTTEALRRDIGALREILEKEVSGHVELCREKFHSIERQFEQVERLRIEQKGDTAKAVDDALTAQKDAVAKQETSTIEQIRSLSQKGDADRESLRREISDLKDRITIIEGQKAGAKEDRSGLYATIGIGVTVILVIIAVVGLLVSRGGG
jgi:chromosome segregation ATPase